MEGTKKLAYLFRTYQLLAGVDDEPPEALDALVKGYQEIYACCEYFEEAAAAIGIINFFFINKHSILLCLLIGNCY